VRRSAGFLLRFLALAGALFALWNFAGLADAYGRVVALVSQPLLWLTSGFHIDALLSTPRGLQIVIARGTMRDSIPMRPQEMFSGVIPFLALVGAAAGVGLRRRLIAAGVGLAVLFVFHVGLMIVGPYMTGLPQAGLPLVWIRRVNTMIDIFYGFYGLVGYAALPFLLWLWLLRFPATRAKDRAA
jgi:hypothetical protein